MRRVLRPGTGSRLASVVVDLLIAAAVCVIGFRFLALPLQTLEAAAVAWVLGLLAPGKASGVLPTHVLLFRGDGEIIDAFVTPSCSSILSVLGLSALTAVILRRRRLHAVAGLLTAIAALLVLNHLRLLMSALAGLWWGDGALILFHDWVGTLWSLLSTLLGFLLLVWVTLPSLERAEQDVDGRHTARRPESWALPGMGYRQAEDGARARAGRRRQTLAGFLHRRVYPRRLSAWLSARREAARIDYRLGHLSAGERAERIAGLVADGIGAHAATLVAVASLDRDPVVLDRLADAIAARQWEPVTNHRVVALRLWARGWLMARPAVEQERRPTRTSLAETTIRVPRIAVPPRTPPPRSPPPPQPERGSGPHPISFARPPAPSPHHEVLQ